MASNLVPISRELLQRLTRWIGCMSYNDSYFSEPQGELKRTANEIEHAVNRFDFPGKGQVRDSETEVNMLADKFLAWPLPDTVNSDMCVTDRHYAFPRSGTNLLTAEEARLMVRYLLSQQEHSYLQSKWQTGIPPTKENDYDQYIVAVRRANDPKKVFVFAACYANNYNEELLDKDGNDYVADGWYDVGHDTSGEFDNLFMPTLQPGDELLAWQELPTYNP